MLDGVIVFENDEFYVRKNNGQLIRFELEAEGLKKISLLWQLLMTDNLTENSILIWDEPEANLNPKYLPKIVECLLELSRQGVQIFLSTHNYIFAKYFDVAKKVDDKVIFHSLYFEEKSDGVKCDTQSYFENLKHKDISAAFNEFRNKKQAWMNLTNEEQKLYNIAVGIIDKANKRSSEVEKVRYIHEAICNRVESFELTEHATAINALVYKKTDCDGFAESFYMLGLMCGLNVREVYGTAKGKDGQWGEHAWNFITFSNGKSYCIDVTNGFNVKKVDFWTFEAMKPYYSCEWSIIPNLQ